MHIKLVMPVPSQLPLLLQIEQGAWGGGGDLNASADKIAGRLRSFPEGVTLAVTHEIEPVGSQYAFRFHWDGLPDSLKSWEEHTSHGWTERMHQPDGKTGFLVGVGVLPKWRGVLFEHDRRWSGRFKASEFLIAVTLENLLTLGVERVIGNARVPGYHQHSELGVEEYCRFRRPDGKLADPVLRFHERMGARILKPVPYSMKDPESLNAGCWVVYERRFEG
ncbi:MAG: hypothetical protein AAB483_00115 [Patescibacteria group bacterium]